MKAKDNYGGFDIKKLKTMLAKKFCGKFDQRKKSKKLVDQNFSTKNSLIKVV